MKDVFKNYKRYLSKSRKQTQYLKDNWSFDKMAEKINLLPNLKAAPKSSSSSCKTLPKLKKVGDKTRTPKIKITKT